MSESKGKNSSSDKSEIAFKAEIKQLLNILVHSLYTEREIFLRELISNASDALNQIRFEMLTNRSVLDSDAKLEIRINVDSENGILTISDTGVGMTRGELIENLGIIAHSGAQAFIEASKDQSQDLSNIIGQFGVGFYSVFMVAEWVKVTSRSYCVDAEAATWQASGADTFTLSSSEKVDRGTKIEIKLKEDSLEYLEEYNIKRIIRKHSDYIAFPIYVGENEEQVNRQTALWRTPKGEITEEDYIEFYKQFTLELEPPLLHIHTSTDAPLQVYSVLYIPSKFERGVLSLRKEDGLKLYSRNVLIQEYSKDLLPDHFRFIVGVVDTEDLPLNISRESIQSNAMITRLNKILTSQVISAVEDLAENDKEKFEYFWIEFGRYIKQGIATDLADRESLYPLLRFRTNHDPDTWSSLDSYVERMKTDQKDIYYLLGDDEKSIIRSPHLDYFRHHEFEVLFLTDPIDVFMLMGLTEFKDHKLQNIASPDLDLPEIKIEEDEGEEDLIPDDEFSNLINRFENQLGERVTQIRASNRLSDSVARLVDPEGAINPEIQRAYRLMDQEFEIPAKVLELNPRHAILRKLLEIPEEDELSQAVIEQVCDSALLIEGLHPDPASMIPRIQKLIEAAMR
jgi:molecular chaperone HtpG